MIVAYECKSPNLVRGGYTFANPRKFPSNETETGHYASTTGNAIFWSPSKSFTDILGNEYFQSYKVEDCKNRTFTFYFGEEWEPYQFAKGEFSRIRRISDDEVTWTKEMLNPIFGTDTRVKYIHTLKGNKHIITMEVDGKDAIGKDAKFRLSPYFHQGWDLAPTEELNDPFVPDWKTVGQERNVFASINDYQFAFSENNPDLITKTVSGKSERDGISLKIFNKNPGIGLTCDDNPDFNRGFTLNIKEKKADVTFIDLPMNNEFVTAEINFGKHKVGQNYTVEFEYWKESDL